MELKKNHCKEHDLSFFLILTVTNAKVDNLLSVKCVQSGLQRSLLGVKALQDELTLEQNVGVVGRRT